MDKIFSQGLAASLSFGFLEKESNYSIDKEDLVIEKYAGISIYQPTIDNVEQFVLKYALNEFARNKSITGVGVQLTPASMSSTKPDYVEEANGAVTFKVLGVDIEVPFLVIDGELLPFDVIQHGGQRVPYSRENIEKIAIGIQSKKKLEDGMGEFEPYVKLDKPINSTSSIGFLGDLLRIQEEHTQGRTSNGSMYVTASYNIERALEKLATIKPVNDDEWNFVEGMVRDAYVKKEVDELRKEAKEMKNTDLDDKACNIFSKIESMPFVDANTLKHGDVVTFPDFCNKELSMTKGIVLSDYIGMAGFAPKKTKIIVTQDGRMKMLDNAEKFLCIKIDDSFDLPYKSISSVSNDDVILAFNGDKAIVPSRVSVDTRKILKNGETGYGDTCSEQSRILSSAKGGNEVRALSLHPIYSDSKSKSIFSDKEFKEKDGPAMFDEKRARLVLLNGEKFSEISYGDFVSKKAKELGVTEDQVSNLCSKDFTMNKKQNKVFCTDEETKVVVIKGVIKDYLKDKKDFENFANGESVEMEVVKEASFMKLAETKDYVEIRNLDRNAGIYDVKVSYIDKSKEYFKRVYRDYKGIEYLNAREILRAAGFEPMKIAEIMARSKRENFIKVELPENSNAMRLDGGQVHGPVKETMEKIKKNVFDSNVSDALSAEVLGTLITGAAIGLGASAGPVSDFISNMASESKMLSASFEKLAMSKQSNAMLKVAKTMATSAMLSEKVAEVVNGKNQYPMLREVVAHIVEAKPYLEKLANDLVDLKVDQYRNKTMLVNPGHLQGAFKQINNMYKVASCLNKL